jgi:glyoxylase-like metal-dependent hydrolase (beta-lactamase superfamily II)
VTTHPLDTGHGARPGREVIAIRYASKTRTRGEEFQSFDLYGEPDGPCTMANYFWMVRDPDRILLVDTGFSVATARKRARALEIEPLEALRLLGVEPQDVDHVIMSHMHFDHIGNIGSFPNATMSVAQAEYDFWTSAIAQKPLFDWVVEEDEIRAVTQLHEDGRLHLIGNEVEELFRGIRVAVVGGHTEGSLIVDVETAGGRTVLASDAVHLYEELEKDWPYFIFANLPDMYRAFDRLRATALEPGVTVIPGHDPEVAARFPAVSAKTPFAVHIGQ